MATTEAQMGYPALAGVMAHPGMSIFKRFAALNARNLLYMQAEILLLERELDVIAGYDHTQNDDPTAKTYATSCEALMESVEKGNGMQWEKILNLREKLDAYSKQVSETKWSYEISDCRKIEH